MYKKNVTRETSLERNKGTEGETLEMKIERVVNNKEPIKDGAPRVYTERKDGVLAGHNVRTDRFEVAIDAMQQVSKTHIAKREEKLAERKKILEDSNKPNNGEPESTQGTEN